MKFADVFLHFFLGIALFLLRRLVTGCDCAGIGMIAWSPSSPLFPYRLLPNPLLFPLFAYPRHLPLFPPSLLSDPFVSRSPAQRSTGELATYQKKLIRIGRTAGLLCLPINSFGFDGSLTAEQQLHAPTSHVLENDVWASDPGRSCGAGYRGSCVPLD